MRQTSAGVGVVVCGLITTFVHVAEKTMAEYASNAEVEKLYSDLKFAADPNCKKCFGRGFKEKSWEGMPYVCKCVWDTIKKDESLTLGEYIRKHRSVLAGTAK